ADDDVAVGIASRVIAGKGHDVLLDAFASLAPQLPQLRLLVAGKGPLQEPLARRADELGGADRVRLPGFVADVRGFMHACDVIVFPTLPELSEGFGLAALEAMA